MAFSLPRFGGELLFDLGQSLLKDALSEGAPLDSELSGNRFVPAADVSVIVSYDRLKFILLHLASIVG
jgi:hypothetical protein